MRSLIVVLLTAAALYAQEVYATFDVAAKKSASLAFVASGIVEKVNAEIGDVVKKDAVLAKLQNDDIAAMLEVSKTALKYAKKDFERQTKIKNLIDEAKFDVVANRYESAKNQYAYQKALYEKTFLQAPFDGVIFAKHIEVGDAVSGMMLKTVYEIQSTKTRKLILSYDQKYHKSVKVGQTFRYHLDGDKKTYEAKITKIYPRADEKTRKMHAEALVNDLLVGLFGDGFIEVR